MYNRPYKTETDVFRGCGVSAGAKDETVKVGAGDPVGIYSFANDILNKSAGESIGITVSGLAKARAKGNVTAGKKGIIDTDGRITACPTAPGKYETICTFLESGTEDEYVDVFVERNTITITA